VTAAPASSLPANIIEAMRSPAVWGKWFADGDWRAWECFLAAVFGLPLPEGTQDLFSRCTALPAPSGGRAAEAFALVGRRGGKTRIMATIAAWCACFEDWREHLAPGEQAHIILASRDKEQASIGLSYLESLIGDHPALKKLIKSSGDGSIELRNRVIIRVAAASFRGLRGFAVPVFLADELAFWADGETSSNPASEILASIRPSMLQFGGRGLLLAASSVYRKAGPLWEAHQKYFGQPGRQFVWLAPTEVMHQLDAEERAYIDRQRVDDPEKAAAEFDCCWRQDITDFVDPAAVDRSIMAGVGEVPPVPGGSYYAAIDPAGGSGGDSYTLCICHCEAGGRAVQDCLREWAPPFSPAAVSAEAASILRGYGIAEVTLDHFGGEFAREPLRERGVSPIVSELRASDIYLEFLAALNSGLLGLLDNTRQRTQLCQLERKTGAGRDRVDHPRLMHDDLINAGALALVTALRDRSPALMHRRHFLTSAGKPVPDPQGWPFLYSILLVSDDGVVGVATFAVKDLRHQPPHLVLVDVDVAPLSGTTIVDGWKRLSALHQQLRIAGPGLDVDAGRAGVAVRAAWVRR
jgi:hypothetical protein